MAINYDLALTDWISIGLHKNTLEATLTAIENNEPLPELLVHVSNREYIRKILREEVIKQFSKNTRPVLEVVLNSVDARPKGCADYKVEVKVKHKKCSIKDNGIGMSLDDVLRVLIIPFNSDKNGLEEIGRFGVGFLSTFKYCVGEPLKGRVCIDTRTGSSGYKIEFYSTSASVGDLRMSVKRCRANPKGTKIDILTKTEHPEIMNEYLANHLNNIFSDRCRIFLNGSCVNESNGTWYSHPVNLCVDNKRITQRVGFRVDKTRHKYIQLTSQGVLIKSKTNRYFPSTISFPTAVQLVEGRTEFIDDNYFICAKGVFCSFEKYLQEALEKEEDEKKQNKIRSDALNFVPVLLVKSIV